MNPLQIAERSIAAMIGLGLLYQAFFLYEDEDGILQNRLEAAWVMADDLHRTFSSKQAAILSRCATFAINFIDRLFGRKLVSFRKILSLYILSFVSGAFSLVVVGLPDYGAGDDWLHGIVPDGFYSDELIGYLLPAVLLGALALIPVFTSKRVIFYPALAVGAIGTFYFQVFLSIADFAISETSIIASISIMFDLMFVEYIRWLLRRVVLAQQAKWMVAWFFMCLLSASILIVPFFVLTLGQRAIEDRLHSRFWLEHMGDFVLVLSTNTFDLAFVVLLTFLLLLCLANNQFWPKYKRILYATQRWKLANNSKVLAAVGLTFLLLALPDRLATFRSVVAFIKHLF